MTEFEKYLKQAREEFAYEVSKYTIENNLALRTASDSLLIAFDQATEKAINYTHSCETDCKHPYYSLIGEDSGMPLCLKCNTKLY